MKRKVIVAGFGAALLLVVGAYLWGPPSVPPGQPALLTLTAANFSAFETSFDANSSGPLLVLLLSPT
jgi:hypothetical protein